MISFSKMSGKTLVLILVLSLSGIFGCVPTTTVNSVDLDAILAAPQFAGQPEPEWGTSLAAADVDFVRQLDDNTMFLGTMAARGYMQTWGLYQKEIMLLDLSSGKVLWRHTRLDLGSQVEDLMVTARSLIVVGQAFEAQGIRMSCFDRKTGERLWFYDTPQPSAYTLDAENGQIVVAMKGQDSAVLMAYGVADGKALWEKTFADIAGAESNFTLNRFDRDLLVLGKGAKRFRIKDGKELWSTVSLPGVVENPLSASLLDNKLLLSSESGIGALDFKSGKVLWNFPVSTGRIIGQDAAVAEMFLFVRTSDGTMLLQVHAISSGKKKWELPLESDIRSHVLFGARNCYFSTKNKVYAVSRTTGKKKMVADLPAALQNETGLLDRLAFQDNVLVVAREIGIAAYSLKTGKMKYAHALKDSHVFSYQYLSQKYALRTLQGASSTDRAGAYLALNQELRNQIVRSQTGVDASLTNNVGYGSGFEVAAQAAVFAQSMVSVGAAFRQGAVNENLNVNRRQIVAARNAQQRALQKGYFVRPFYRDGWGVTLVRISDGRRCDLYVSPANPPLLVNSGNLPVFVLDDKAKKLFAVGLGLEPDPENTYEKVGFDLDVYKTWPGIPNNWILPYTRLMKYDVKDLSFTEKRMTDEGLPELGEKERELRKAILDYNDDRTEELVEAGADVNAVDQLGFNALFYAAITDNKGIVKFLIKNGADATRRDHGGLLAYHYTFLTHAMNRSTGPIRSAFLDQQK